jgi:hypothetical protein
MTRDTPNKTHIEGEKYTDRKWLETSSVIHVKIKIKLYSSFYELQIFGKKKESVDFFKTQTYNHRFIIFVRSHVWTRCRHQTHSLYSTFTYRDKRELLLMWYAHIKLPSCFLFSCLSYSSLLVSFSFTTPSARKRVTIRITIHHDFQFFLFVTERERELWSGVLIQFISNSLVFCDTIYISVCFFL